MEYNLLRCNLGLYGYPIQCFRLQCVHISHRKHNKLYVTCCIDAYKGKRNEGNRTQSIIGLVLHTFIHTNTHISLSSYLSRFHQGKSE